MALAARCPNCQALFRVVADQLKLRGGLVRCGICRQVFDAIGSLNYIDDEATVAQRGEPGQHAPAVRSAVKTPPTLHVEFDRRALRAAAADPLPDLDVPTVGGRLAAGAGSDQRGDKPAPLATPPPAAAIVRPAAEPLAVTRPADAAEAPRPEPIADGWPGTEARADKPGTDVEPQTRSVDALPEEQAPLFLRNRLARRRRGISIVFGGGSALLGLALALQIGIALRGELMMQWPELRPLLLQVCRWYGCSVAWPMHAELLAVVGSELQAIPGTDAMELGAVIRNRAGFTMALPALEVTLTDTQNRAVARKVFTPVDYLAAHGEDSARIDEGLAAGADYQVRLVFEARALNAAGFVVYPFYP